MCPHQLIQHEEPGDPQCRKDTPRAAPGPSQALAGPSPAALFAVPVPALQYDCP